MKKIFFAVSIFTIIALSSLTVFAIEGNGTAEAPFIITDQGGLELVTDFPDCHFKLANDIELKGIWIPLCEQTSSGYFKGVFDGAGYTISNLSTDSLTGGLFKNNSGTVKNLNIIINKDGMKGSGGISHVNSGTISNCVVEGNVLANSVYSGGICGRNYKEITQCKYKGNIENVEALGYIGGICGYNGYSSNYSTTYSAVVKNCVALSNVTGKYCTGGISGGNSMRVSNCYFIGAIISGSTMKGGIVGLNDGCSEDKSELATVSNCYAIPTFNNSAASGVAGCYYQSKVIRSYYDKTVSGILNTSEDRGIPRSTSALKVLSTYVNWDFETVWGIDANVNDGYPYLLWEYAPTDNQIVFDTETQKSRIYLKEAGIYTVIFVDYNRTKFVEADIQPLTLKQGYNSIPTILTLTDGDKVFLWKDLATLVPMCEEAEISSK